MTLAEVIDTLQTWIRNADDEYDREEMGRVAGLKEALHEIKKIEPCEECAEHHACRMKKMISDLPPVQPQSDFAECEDAISRQAALDAFGLSEKSRKYGGDHSGYDTIMLYEVQDALEALPSVQPQPKTGHCKECKYFECDNMAKVDGIPLIVAHEICKKWARGCKTRADGYCFLFEPQESEETE